MAINKLKALIIIVITANTLQVQAKTILEYRRIIASAAELAIRKGCVIDAIEQSCGCMAIKKYLVEVAESQTLSCAGI